jgi:hypothetical protein
VTRQRRRREAKRARPVNRPGLANDSRAAAADRRRRLIDAAWVVGTGLFVYPIGLFFLQDPLAALGSAAIAAFIVEAVRAMRHQRGVRAATGPIAWGAQAGLLLLSALVFGELFRPWVMRAWGGNDLPLMWGGTAAGYLASILGAGLVWLAYRRFRVWPFVSRSRGVTPS